ncbi:MAG: aldo/keto reductase [Nocardioidaceae bacterium]|nr:aldo/keto reductase [Nocardioidaceae bacterium]MCL2613688.1 aldo/keto reductase [Nocardioidaceae bacterium]
MEQRSLTRLGRDASVIGIGTWQLGAEWGEVSDADAQATLGAAINSGTTFIDTADVYGDGLSEQRVAQFLAGRGREGLTVATKMGRRVEQLPEHYSLDNFRLWTERSRRNLGVDTLDLVQLHCPPTEVIESDATYDALDTLVEEGAIAAYGVSVETCDQALAAIARAGVATVQIILNAFRRKPLDEVLPAAQEAGVGIIARVPLASGLLSGRYDEQTTFAADDHRTFNRHGEAFDVGETFSGVDYADGVRAAQEFAALVRDHGPEGATPAQVALAWVAQQPGVSTVIPGARSVVQARANSEAGSLPALDPRLLDGLRDIYDRWFRAAVHDRW